MARVVGIYDKVFRQEFVWVKVKSSKEFSAYMRKKISNYDDVVDTENELDDCAGETISLLMNDKEVIFFWFNVDEPSAIVHELLHAVIKCCRARGITLSEDSEETFCYMLSFLYEEVLKELNTKNRKKRK